MYVCKGWKADRMKSKVAQLSESIIIEIHASTCLINIYNVHTRSCNPCEVKRFQSSSSPSPRKNNFDLEKNKNLKEIGISHLSKTKRELRKRCRSVSRVLYARGPRGMRLRSEQLP